jgi:hypothetical protein
MQKIVLRYFKDIFGDIFLNKNAPKSSGDIFQSKMRPNGD